jgi:S1/P1 Nuclease
MKQILTVGIAVVLFFLIPSSANAWNAVGHMAVAKLAYDRMSEGEQLKLFTLLKKHPHYTQFLAASKPDGVSEAEWVIMRSAVWSDWIRPRRKDNRGTDATKYSRSEDHYVNIPLIAPGSEEFFAGKTLVDPDLPNILTALKSRCNDIKTKTAADQDKAVAACWVFHLIGDIHQPLHSVAYFSSEKAFQTGDQGGNKFAVREGTKSWKFGIDTDYGDDSDAHQAELYRMALKVAERLRGLELKDADKEQLEKNKTFDSWSKESFELAKSVAYMKGDGTGLMNAVEAPFNGRAPEGAAELDEAYVKRAKETADKRVVFAGKRLADRMKMVLK